MMKVFVVTQAVSQYIAIDLGKLSISSLSPVLAYQTKTNR